MFTEANVHQTFGFADIFGVALLVDFVCAGSVVDDTGFGAGGELFFQVS
jgi:hypothetical protein